MPDNSGRGKVCCCGTRLDLIALHGMREGINESRSGFEDCIGVGRIALFGASLSLDDVCATRPCVVDDVQHLCYARRFLASRNPQPIGESQLDLFYSMVELRSCRGYGHAGLAKYDFPWRTGGCGDPRCHRCGLACACSRKAACRTRPHTVVAFINHIDEQPAALACGFFGVPPQIRDRGLEANLDDYR
jgi:hypothetical protein